MKSAWPDLNRRPRVPKDTRSLQAELHAVDDRGSRTRTDALLVPNQAPWPLGHLVWAEGLEPPVIPAPKAGDLAAGLRPDGVLARARTGDLHVRSVVRFRLRHEYSMVCPIGFEPMTSRFAAWCASGLRYGHEMIGRRGAAPRPSDL